MAPLRKVGFAPASVVWSGMDEHCAYSVDPSLRLSRVRGLFDAARSLQCKATILVVALTLCVVAAACSYLVRSSVKVLREQREEQLVQLASMLAHSAATSLAGGDRQTLQRIAEDSSKGAPLAYVLFSDVHGEPLAGAHHRSAEDLLALFMDPHEKPPSPGIPSYHPSVGKLPAFEDVVYPINVPRALVGALDQPTELVGYVRAGMISRGWHQLLSSKLDMLIGVGMIATVVAIPLGFLLIRRIVSPLEDLAGSMYRFSRGELHVRGRVRRGDEIGRLVLAFNRMADQHEQTHLRSVRLNEDLERRVARRTKQLRELAAREPLTGLYNRRHFGEVLARCFSEAMRYRRDLSCIMLDLDEFKAVNDALGHPAGDAVLMVMASTITSQLRSADVPARYGGDEFIILLPETDADRARILGERIVEQFTTDLAKRFPRCQVGVSMGIASLGCLDPMTMEDLVRAADRSLYEAKAAGKSRIISAADPAAVVPV